MNVIRGLVSRLGVKPIESKQDTALCVYSEPPPQKESLFKTAFAWINRLSEESAGFEPGEYYNIPTANIAEMAIGEVQGSSVLSYLGSTGIGKLVVNNSSKVRSVAKSILIGDVDFDAVICDYRERIKAIEGNEHLIDLIESFSPAASKFVLEEMAGDGSETVKGEGGPKFPGFSAYLTNENKHFQSIIKSIFYKVVFNFASHTKTKLVDENKEFKGEIAAEVVKELMQIAFSEFDLIEEEFEKLELSEETELEKKEQYYALLKPATDKFLKLAFPNGKDDLQLKDSVGPFEGVASAVWKEISEEIVPEILYQSIRLVKKPPHHTNEDLEILKKPGGAALLRIANFVGEQSEQKAREILYDASNSIGEGVVDRVIEYTQEKNETCPEKAKQVSKWLGEKVKEFASDPEDPITNKLWTYSGKNIRSMLIHAFASMGKDGEGNLIPLVGNKGLKVINDFFKNNEKLLEAKFSESKEILDIKERERFQNQLFLPLSESLLSVSDLVSNPLVKIVKDNVVPDILRQMYADMVIYNGNQETFKQRLVEKLFDPSAFANNLPKNEFSAVLEEHESAIKQAQKDSGITQAVEELSSACGMFSEDIIRIVREFAENDTTGFLAELVDNSLFENYQLSEEEKAELAEGIHDFFGAKKDLNPSWDYGKKVLENVLFKLLTTVAEHTEVEGSSDRKENKNSLLLSHAIRRIFSILSSNIPKIDADLKTIANSEGNEKEKKEAIYALFQPLVDDFLELVGDRLDEILPVPNLVKIALKNKLRTLFLPVIFYEVYKDLNSLREQVPEKQEDLKNIFKSDAANSSVNVIADYIKDFVPFYMETNPGKVTEIIERCGSKYFNFLTPEHQEGLKAMLEKNIHVIGKDPALKDISEAVAEYSKAMMLKIFSGLFNNIHSKEKSCEEKGENFLLSTSVAFIKIASDYFRRVNKIPPDERNYPAYVVPPKVMLKGFSDAGELHEAMKKDIDPEATEEEKRQQRLESFFVPFAKDLLEISGFDGKDFPVPSPMREEMWKVFTEAILPEAMLNIFEDCLSPASINDLLLTVIDGLTNEVDGFNADIDKSGLESIDDSSQKELNGALGELIKEMIDLVPESLTKIIFKSDKIKGMTAESIGRIVRKRLDSKKMTQYIESALSNFKLKRPDINKGKTEARILKENRIKEKELNKKMTAYISKQLKETFKSFLRNKWQKFQKSFDRLVEKFFGKPGKVVKSFFDKVFHFIFFSLLGPIFNFIIFKVIWFFVDLKVASKTKEIIRDTHMPIHENLVYKFVDKWVDIMKGKTKPSDIEDDVIKGRRGKTESNAATEAKDGCEIGSPAAIGA